MPKIDVNYEDNSEQVEAEFEEKIRLALDLIGETAEGYAKQECPVDTGRLRNSISHRQKGDSTYIGTNVEYAPSVEYRDIAHKTGKAHFLKDAATNHTREYKDLVEMTLKK